MQADEAIAGSNGECLVALLVVGVGGLDLGLLGVAAIGIARLEFLEILDGLVVSAVGHRGLGFGVELVGRPAGSFVDLLGQEAAAGNEDGQEHYQQYG